ncbi:hypothetical protein [Arcobacter sp. s6]|uniref:hypothetical protein n=1 Tax=Arcobacter sp. s6 TaxID=3230363 RepID=UPI0034A013D6
MIHKPRKYFSLFGILIATVNRKLQSINCMIHTILLEEIPKITKLLQQKQIKSIKRYTTHNI